MLDLSPCRCCGFEFTPKMAIYPCCGWPRHEGDGGVREPANPIPTPPDPEKVSVSP